MLRPVSLVCALVLTGCSIPRDASHTLEHIRGGVVRVGIVENDPWVVDQGTTVDGIEGRLVARVASSIGARIEWVRAPEFELIRSLHDRKVQLVIGGFDSTVPWAKEVAFTRPYLKSVDGKTHVLAAPPGENAWLMLLDKQIEAFKPPVPSTAAEFSP